MPRARCGPNSAGSVADVARHAAQRNRLLHAGRQRPVQQHAVAVPLQVRQAPLSALALQRTGGHGQHHAVGRQQVQDGGCQHRRGVQQHDAIQRRHRGQQVRRAEHGLQGSVIEAALGRPQLQRDPFVLRVGDGTDLYQREWGSSH
jgi:hypothetical protein